jgi:DNA-directed RNA polymerase specialized sigma subunit
LTDSQRTEVIGRIYNTLKQNPVLNLKQFQSKDNGKDVEDRTAKFAVRKGSDATAKAVAEATGVSVRTVRYAGKFAEAVAALANFQCRPATWAIAFALLIAPHNWCRSRPQAQTD